MLYRGNSTTTSRHRHPPTSTCSSSTSSTSCRSCLRSASSSYHDNHDQKSVLSMKKSAEIAAVFSGAKINQTTDIVNDRLSNGDMIDDCDKDSTDEAYDTKRRGTLTHHRHHQTNSTTSTCQSCGGFSRSNLHTSLGYFP